MTSLDSQGFCTSLMELIEIMLFFSQQLEMEDEDTIDVFQQQTGGLF